MEGDIGSVAKGLPKKPLHAVGDLVGFIQRKGLVHEDMDIDRDHRPDLPRAELVGPPDAIYAHDQVFHFPLPLF